MVVIIQNTQENQLTENRSKFHKTKKVHVSEISFAYGAHMPSGLSSTVG